MRSATRFIQIGFGLAAAVALAADAQPAQASSCQVGNNISFVDTVGNAHAPGDVIQQWGVVFGFYYSEMLHPEYNGIVAAYVANPGGGSLYFLRYSDNTWVTYVLAQDIWICANDLPSIFRVKTQWDSYGMACQNCGFWLGPIWYNGMKFGLDMMGGNDTFYGGYGDDWVWGFDGYDVINGGEGGGDHAFGGESQDGSTEYFY